MNDINVPQIMGLKDMPDERMINEKAKEREYLHEHFTVTHILYGKIEYLEDIKKYLIGTYVEKGLLRIIKPTYSKKCLFAVNESHYQPYENQSSSEYENDGGHFYFAYVLRGEVTYCEQVKKYITDVYVKKGLVDMTTTPYSKEKQYIVKEQKNGDFCTKGVER